MSSKSIVRILLEFQGSRITMAFSCGARSAFKLMERDYLRNMLSRRQLQGFVMRVTCERMSVCRRFSRAPACGQCLARTQAGKHEPATSIRRAEVGQDNRRPWQRCAEMQDPASSPNVFSHAN